jgi:hypothetical protein
VIAADGLDHKEYSMKKLSVIALCILSVAALGQSRGGGRPGGTGGGAPGGFGGGAPGGVGGGQGRSGDFGGAASNTHAGRDGAASNRAAGGQPEHAQQPLKPSQINGGAFRMLEQKTGMTQSQLESMYQSSGARNFGEFTSAVVVSKNLGLDTNAVLKGMETQSLGQTLKDLGVPSKDIKPEIKKAQAEVRSAS